MKTSSFSGLRPALCLLALSLTLAACSSSEKSATQVAARVNDGEISVHQINFVLQRSNVQPEQAKAASEQILTRLVDQELAVQQAVDRKLDRAPEVVQQLEAARREVLQRAWLESVASTAAKPDDAAIQKYFDEHPELFAQRRIYTYRVLGVQASAERVAELRAMVERRESLPKIAEWARSQNLRIATDAGTKAAEQLPMASVPRLAQMKDGQITLSEGQGGVEILELVRSQTEPVDLARAKPVIERFLGNQRRTEVLQREVRALRESAKIEYKGSFAYLADQAQSAPVAEVLAPVGGAEASAPASSLEQGIAAGIR